MSFSTKYSARLSGALGRKSQAAAAMPHNSPTSNRPAHRATPCLPASIYS
jgi:hypothetical protein